MINFPKIINFPQNFFDSHEDKWWRIFKMAAETGCALDVKKCNFGYVLITTHKDSCVMWEVYFSKEEEMLDKVIEHLALLGYSQYEEEQGGEDANV